MLRMTPESCGFAFLSFLVAAEVRKEFRKCYDEKRKVDFKEIYSSICALRKIDAPRELGQAVGKVLWKARKNKPRGKKSIRPTVITQAEIDAWIADYERGDPPWYERPVKR